MESVGITELSCSTCGVTWWITQAHERQLRKSHDTFYCPSGHGQIYSQKNTQDLLADAKKKCKLAEERCAGTIEDKERLESEVVKLQKSVKSYKLHLAKKAKKKH